VYVSGRQALLTFFQRDGYMSYYCFDNFGEFESHLTAHVKSRATGAPGGSTSGWRKDSLGDCPGCAGHVIFVEGGAFGPAI
jgi:hypothetical protein